MSGMAPCFVNCGQPACQELGCVRVYNAERMSKAKNPACSSCGSTNTKFTHTYEDWFDGDEDDWYECLNCGHIFYIYIPR